MTRSAVLGLVVALTLGGCDGTASNPAQATSTPVAVAAPNPAATTNSPIPDGFRIPGRFVGTVVINGTEYFGDAIVTVDGAIRLYIGGAYSPSGVIQVSRPTASAQLVGTLAMNSDSASGIGNVIGQGCSDPQAARFCARVSNAQFSLTASASELRGAIQVSTSEGEEVWELNLRSWDNYYRLPAGQGGLAGQYTEQLAEFAPDRDVALTVDSRGGLHFESPKSGCVGSGTFLPHRDGALNVYDVSLVMDGCSGPYAYLNGLYAGLATPSPAAYWDYDSSLRVWMTKPGTGTAQPAALTMWGRAP